MKVDSQMAELRMPMRATPLGVLGELSTLRTVARETLCDFFELASLETRRAGLGLVWMIVGGLVATIFFVTAWAGLMVVLAIYMIFLGMLPIAAVVLVAAVNLIAGAGMLYWCIGLSRRLLFAATRRQLAGVSSSQATSAMTRVPAMADIDAAELCLVQSRHELRQSEERTRIALRTAIIRPSTLGIVAVATGISVFLVSRQRSHAVDSLRDGAGPATRASSRDLVRTFIPLFGAQVMAFVLHRGAQAWKQRKQSVGMPVRLATGDTAIAGHDDGHLPPTPS